MSNMVEYKAPPVVSRFMQDNSRMRILCGPFGSSKTTGGLIEVVRRAAEQRRGPGGKRRSRWAVVRNTNPMLVDTTLKSWFTWFPDGLAGTYKQTGKTYMMRFGDVEAEVMFRALDDAADVRNLLSLELTGAFIDEAREIPKEILEGLDGRIGRYPAVKDGGCSWSGIWAATNPPTVGTYWHLMMERMDPDNPEQERPNDWAVYKQPGGMLETFDSRGNRRLVPNPDAENMENLPPGYYEMLSKDKTEEYIRVYVLGRYGTSLSGKPVHPSFNEAMHVARESLIPNVHNLLVVASDFGLTPAMALMQQDSFGRVLVLDEIVETRSGLKQTIANKLKPLLRNKYNSYQVFVTGDPSGNTASQTDERSCADIFKDAGFKKVKFAYSNNPVDRTNALDTYLTRLTEAGPAFLIDPKCGHIKRGLNGGYHYKIQKDGVTSATPVKNMSSHIIEAVQYGAMFFERGVDTENDRKQRAAMLQEINSHRNIYHSRRR